MFASLSRFLRSKKPSYSHAAESLRLIYVLIFLAQTFLALAVALLVHSLSPAQRTQAIMAQVLTVFALIKLPIALLLNAALYQHPGKANAIAATVVVAVMLSSAAWYTAFAWLIGATLPYVLGLVALLMLYYALGLLLSSSYAKLAILPSPKPQKASHKHSQKRKQRPRAHNAARKAKKKAIKAATTATTATAQYPATPAIQSPAAGTAEELLEQRRQAQRQRLQGIIRQDRQADKRPSPALPTPKGQEPC